jgi:hypothetical protein
VALPPKFMLNIHDPPTPIPRMAPSVSLFSHSFYMPTQARYLSFGRRITLTSKKRASYI